MSDINQEIDRFEQSLINLNNAFRQHRDFIKARFGISGLEMELIQFVIKNGPQKMKAISEHFHIKLSTLTSIIDKAERARIVKRVNSKEDRRVVYLDLTRKGRGIYDDYNKYLRETMMRMQANLDNQTFEQFVVGIKTFTELSAV